MELKPIYQFGRFILETKSQSLFFDSKEVKLEPRIFDVLHLLLSKPNEVITKEEFFDFVWEEKVVSDWALSRAIKEVRKKLKDDGETQWVKTIYGKGYIFTQEVKIITPEQFRQTKPYLDNNDKNSQVSNIKVENPELKNNKSKENNFFSGFGLLKNTALVSIFAIVLFYLFTRVNSVESQQPKSIFSVVVLPINNLDASDDYNYLVNGLTDVIIGRLAQKRNLRVISRTSAIYYHDKKMSPKAIANELNVESIIEGSFFTEKEQLNINLRLINAETEELIWSIDEKQPIDAVYSFYQTTANKVMNNLLFEPKQNKTVNQLPYKIANQEAFKLYLRAAYLFKKRKRKYLIEAQSLLLEALKHDQSFAEAYSLLAAVYIQLSNYSFNSSIDRFTLAKNAIDKALELKPNLSEAWAQLGLIQASYHYDFKTAEQSYLKAIELNPDNYSAKQWYAELLSITSRHDESLALLEETWKNDPFNSLLISVWASAFLIKGDYQKAVEKLSLAENIGDKVLWHNRELAYAYQWQGKLDESMKVRFKQMNFPRYSEEQLASLQQHMQSEGIAGFWRWRIPFLLKRWEKGHLNATLLAEAYAGIGEYEEMLFWFKKAIEQKGEYWLQVVVRSPEFYPYRDKPEFKAILSQYGISIDKN